MIKETKVIKTYISSDKPPDRELKGFSIFRKAALIDLINNIQKKY